MTPAAERMRRTRLRAVRRRIACQVDRLKPESERDALAWIEAAGEFDQDEAR